MGRVSGAPAGTPHGFRHGFGWSGDGPDGVLRALNRFGVGNIRFIKQQQGKQRPGRATTK
jgi:hypothetical protein